MNLLKIKQGQRLIAVGLWVCLLALVALGCQERPVIGGSKGILMAAGEPLSDIQLTVHREKEGTFEPLGFAVSKTDGKFELFTPGAAGPLWLSPGEYRFTLESAGAPLEIPAEYLTATRSPLRTSIDNQGVYIKLEIESKFELVR
jgi:hypothetical protein